MSVFHFPAFSECTRDPLISLNSHQLLRERKEKTDGAHGRHRSRAINQTAPLTCSPSAARNLRRGVACALRGKKLITYTTHPPRQHLQSEGPELETKSARSATIPQVSRSFMMPCAMFITNASHVLGTAAWVPGALNPISN